MKLSKDQNESTESRDSTTNTQTTTPVNPPNYRFSIYNSPYGVVLENGKGGSSYVLSQAVGRWNYPDNSVGFENIGKGWIERSFLFTLERH